MAELQLQNVRQRAKFQYNDKKGFISFLPSLLYMLSDWGLILYYGLNGKIISKSNSLPWVKCNTPEI